MLVVGLSAAPAQVALVNTKSSTIRTVAISASGAAAAHITTSADGKLSFVAHGLGATPPGVAVVDNVVGTVLARLAYPGGGDPHGAFYDDPKAAASPSIAIASRVIRVTRNRKAAVRLRCGAKTVGSCVGVVNVCAYGKSRFSISSGAKKTIMVRLSKLGFSRLLKSGTLKEPVGAAALDESGNFRRADRMVKLLAPKQSRSRSLSTASVAGAGC